MHIKLKIVTFSIIIYFFLASCSSISEENRNNKSFFFVENAKNNDVSCMKSEYRELQVACHRLQEGDKLAIATREYFPKDAGQQSFIKLTMFLPENAKAGDGFDIDGSIVSVYYSVGLSFMPGKTGCFGRSTKGKIIIISRNKNEITASIEAVFDMKSPLDWPKVCREDRLAKTVTVKYRTFDSLTAWEGRINSSSGLMDETHPKSVN